MRFWWDKSSGEADWTALEPTGNTFTYCNTANTSLCERSVPSYSRVVRRDLYPRVDWVVYGRDGHLEYDLVLRPGADVQQIRLRVDGAASRLDADGRLRVGHVSQWKPYAYQWINGHKTAVRAELRALGAGEYRFALGAYRRDLELTIDPVIETLDVAGGAEDDKMTGSVESGAYRWGTTRSGDWSRLPRAGGTDVFLQAAQAGRGVSTVFWGGEGDEEVAGGDRDSSNPVVCIAGWTSSRNAPLIASRGGEVRPYSGGSSDGFLLEFAWGRLTLATYVGGPGADRLYDVKLLGTVQSQSFAFAGETDDLAWARATVTRFGDGGKIDAVAGTLHGREIELVAIGGSGDDRAMALRRVDHRARQGWWAVSGESDSVNFPAGDLPGKSDNASAARKDLWTGHIRFDPAQVASLRLFGGSGDERFGGLAYFAAGGLYVAGTTNSPDLPQSENPFNGGASDGFLARLDAESALPLNVSYLGGAGRDEIAAMHSNEHGLYLGGSTDSSELALPVAALKDSPGGGHDGLFVWCDPRTTPITALRVGGAGSDAILAVEAVSLGKAFLSGWSDSGDWFKQVDPFTAPKGGRDGFSVAASFPAIGLSALSGSSMVRDPLPTVFVGRDLQKMLALSGVTDTGMDGMVLVRSSDPSKLLVSDRLDAVGTDQLLLQDVDGSQQKHIVLQALGDSGEVDVIIEGRSTVGQTPTFPRRRLRVQLTPSALFFSSLAERREAIDIPFPVHVLLTPVLPGGLSGEAQGTRAGIKPDIRFASSDTEGLSPMEQQPQEESLGRFRMMIRLRREGAYTVTASSPQFPAAPGQVVTVRSTFPVPRIFGLPSYSVPKDHVRTFTVSGKPGDRLRVTSADPSRLLVESDLSPLGPSLEMVFTAQRTVQSLRLAGMAAEGETTVRVEGTLNGTAADEVATIRLISYRVSSISVPRTAAAGTEVYASVTLQPQLTGDDSTFYSVTPRRGAFAGHPLESSNPLVLERLLSGNDGLTFTFSAKATGVTTLAFPDGAPVELASARADVEVVAPHIQFGTDELVIPTGASVPLQPRFIAPLSAFSAVRVRLAENAPLTLDTFVAQGRDVTVDFRSTQVYVSAVNAPAGYEGDLHISAPGIPEQRLRVRVTETVLKPAQPEIRVPSDGSRSGVWFEVSALDGRQALPLSLIDRYERKAVRLRTRVSHPGICEIPEFLEPEYSSSSMLSLRCTSAGETLLWLESAPGISETQPSFTVRIISSPRRGAVVNSLRVFTGNGLQSWFPLESLHAQFGPSLPVGTLTSSDPQRVRLSLDPKAAGREQVTLNGYAPVYVQGFASDGIVPIVFEGVNGERIEIPVHLLASTMAVRPKSDYGRNETSSVLSTEHPLAVPDLELSLVPHLVDAASGKLASVRGLQIRGATDPKFLRGQSSDEAIVEPVAPGALVSETDVSATILFRTRQTGEVVLSAVQPEGFVTVPDSSLRVRVYQQRLHFESRVLLSPDWQVEARVRPRESSAGSIEMNLSITSLDPQKLLISHDERSTGQEAIRTTVGAPFYLQAQGSALAGETVRVRLEGAGYEASELEVPVMAAGLQLQNGQSTIQLRATPVDGFVTFAAGPLDENGVVAWNLPASVRPGAELRLRVESRDPSILEVLTPDAIVAPRTMIRVRANRPGNTQLSVSGPAAMTNAIERVPVVVQPFEFSSIQVQPGAPFLVSRITVRNPTSTVVSLTVSNAGTAPLRFGTSASGAEAPSRETLALTLAPLEQRVLYFEPAQGTGWAIIRLTAPDVRERLEPVSLSSPVMGFLEGSSLVRSLSSGTAMLSVIVQPTGVYGQGEFPVGSASGPVQFQVRSSNPEVVRVTSASVNFPPGTTRANVPLQLTGRGTAVISLIPPPGFEATANRRDVVVTVQ